MKIAQTCQGDTLANLDQEVPNVKKQQKNVMQTVKHASAKIRGLAPGLLPGFAQQPSCDSPTIHNLARGHGRDFLCGILTTTTTTVGHAVFRAD